VGLVRDEADLIQPVQIEHCIDEIWTGENEDVLEQYYNYIDYHFERDGAYMRARTYLDEIKTVSVFGPFQQRGSIEKVRSPKLAADVHRYLNRRYNKVQQR